MFQFRKLRYVLMATSDASKKPRAALLLLLAICQPLIIYFFSAAPISPLRPGFLKIFSSGSFF
ncbi:hypothetical protein HZS_5795 [Henneguya salminicola]|nr:hypothetical protein HZS_5795 [Henneguya salminicola]